MAKHKYLNLNMGLVEENFIVINRKDISLWKSRGFEPIRRYPIFLHKPKLSEKIMLGKPLNINQFGVDSLKNSKISDICTFFGTYGMGGAGFVGFKLESYFGTRWLVYCIWSSGEHILLDNKILQCHPSFANWYKPWIDFNSQEKSLEDLKSFLKGLTIQDIQLSKEDLTIHLVDDKNTTHTIHTQKFSSKFPEQGGTSKKRKSFENGSMEGYWLVIYDGTDLRV